MNELRRLLGVDIDITFHLIFFSLIWVRTLMMVSITPFLFSKPVPRYAAVGIAVVLAIFAYMNLVPEKNVPLREDFLWLILLYLKEVFYGLTIGFAVAIFFHAFESVGQMVDNQRGVSMARLLIPQLGEQGSISGLFLFQLGLVVFLATGGHRVFLEGFFNSFVSLPVLELPRAGAHFLPLIDVYARITADVFLIAIQLSAPIIIAIFLVDIILGITNRFAPQINVWELGFNLKGYIGILLLFFALSAITNEMMKYAEKGNQSASEIVRIMSNSPPPLPEAPIPSGGEKQPETGVPEVKTIK